MRSISADQVLDACESLLEEQPCPVSDALHLDPEETRV
jgi:hypothetical protein